MFDEKIDAILKSKLFLFLIVFLSILSIIHAFNLSMSPNGSTDFSLSPAILFWDKINPYDYYLYSENTDKIIGWQIPIYAHVTYILFYVFTLFELQTANLVWSILNIFFGIMCGLIVSKYQKLENYQIIIVISIFCISTPFRNCISLGQITFLILLSFSSIFIQNSILRNLLLGVSYMKYSFMPVLALTILFKDGLKALFISGLFCLLGWIFFSLFLEQNLFYTLLQPLEVALNHEIDHLNRGDLFTILGFLKSYEIEFNLDIFRVVMILLVSLYLARDISKHNDKLLILSLLLIANLFTFGHLIYDYIVLLPSFVFSFSNRKSIYAKISLLIILYFWFGIRLKDYIIDFMTNGFFTLSPLSYVTNLQVLINFLLLVFLYYMNKKILDK